MMNRLLIPLALICLQPCSALDNFEFLKIQRAQRQVEAHLVKSAVAGYDENLPLLTQPVNNQIVRYPDLRAVFGKALHHEESGFITPSAFYSLLRATQSGSNRAFNAIPLGIGLVKLVNPQASLTFSLSGSDGWLHVIPPAPNFDSAQAAGEMVELYCTVLSRDIPFNHFDKSKTVKECVHDLNQLTDFRGPKVKGEVTPGTYLRGNPEGNLIGPYISQFLYQTVPYGAQKLPPYLTSAKPGIDFLTDFKDWFTVIDGGSTGDALTPNPVPFIRTPRDLAIYVHSDYPGQATVNAALLLLSYGNAALDPNNPYVNNPTQSGFVTFGVGEVFHLVQEAVQEAFKAAWYQKWQVNYRLRPEEFGFYLDLQKNGDDLGINKELTKSEVLDKIFDKYGSYFLAQAFPEGCPAHPSYPSGHATWSAAAVTVLKAYFNEDFEIPKPLMPNDKNDALIPYPGKLTVGGELNKLAANIALGRDHAGVHYRSDAEDGMLLGEKVAIDLLNNEGFLINENFAGFSLTKFDGTKIIVGRKRTL